MSKLTPPTDNDRLHIFESVQFDPELWSLVQRKYNQFEDLHREIGDLQNQRGDLLTQLSKVNESIAKLQQQLVTLSGHEADDDGKEQAEAAAKEEAPQPDWSANTNHTLEPKHEEPEPEADDDEEDNQETVVGLKPLEFEGLDNVNEESTDEEKPEDSGDQKIDIAPYEPAVTAEPASAEPAAPIIEQPIAVTAPEPSQVSNNSAEAPAPESAPMPAEVAELQKLFDEADDQRRQTDSALKLVQLYDGKAETFFAAMCRSHQQSGLSEEDARKEAVKDVQTMIATAQHNSTVPAESKKADDQSKANGKSGGMRRLFSHT